MKTKECSRCGDTEFTVIECVNCHMEFCYTCSNYKKACPECGYNYPDFYDI